MKLKNLMVAICAFFALGFSNLRANEVVDFNDTKEVESSDIAASNANSSNVDQVVADNKTTEKPQVKSASIDNVPGSKVAKEGEAIAKFKYVRKKNKAAQNNKISAADSKNAKSVSSKLSNPAKEIEEAKNAAAKYNLKSEDEDVAKNDDDLKDPRFSQTSDADLKKLLDLAISNSPDVQEKFFNKEESENLVKQADGSVLPVLSANVSAGKQYRSVARSSSTNLTAKELSLGLHQNVFGEGRSDDVKINKSVVSSKRYELEQVKNLVALATIEAYLNVVRYRMIAKVQQDSIDSHSETLEKTKSRLDAGLMRASDLFLTQARTESARSNLTSVNSQLKRSIAELYRYTNSDVSKQNLSDIDGPKSLPKSFDDAWKIVLDSNPIIKAKSHEIETSNFLKKKQDLSLYPSVSVDLQAKKSYDSDGVEGAQKDLSAMLNMKYQFNFGNELYNSKAAGSRLSAKRYEYQKSQSDIYQNLQSLYSDYDEITLRITKLKANRDNLEYVVQKHQKEFEAGFRSLFDLLNTKNEFFNADIQYINAVYDRKIMSYTILANTGELLKYFDK